MSTGREARKSATADDEHYMQRALALARAMLGRTSPNPAVGCVLVRAGKVIGEGATQRGGRPHAEAVALTKAGTRARGSTAYVTFEPCAHFGQTPPCADALVAAGVSRVVVGCIDPFPQVRGRGLKKLRAAKISTTVGVLEDECRRLNEGFITRVATGRPFGLLKLAMSLDGRIAAAGGDSRWISSEASRQLVHRWRSECDAVMVGAGTVRADNPRLTARIDGGHNPVRVIIDPRLSTRPASLVYRKRSETPAIIVTNERNVARAERRYASPPVEILGARQRQGKLDMSWLMQQFGHRGWNRVLIEGGAHLAASALDAGIVDRVAFFVAPRIVGAGLSAVEGLSTRRMRDAIDLGALRVSKIGPDLLLEADVLPRGAVRRRARSGAG
ncbi:MAG TPA: bifunctional diaminohydroxyphosphoribosylaminopyrimidine deaminase/5-amino-6-(5-phosphoribosylamino)uracil reductase RibD [Candidatus Binataceae bacterium]|nr:bifunctional diaminohydroxyphosphoribosylaminopyrimidine deaminase/5-amino-6-(5-phosphoribosylamino)uracil reductase RibD [Candidatus Binataceae bacterium]